MNIHLSVTDLGCIRGNRAVFAGLSFALSAGGAALVSGPNGAGKTSLLRILAGLLRPAAGTIDRAGSIAFAGDQSALDANLPLARSLDFWSQLDASDPVHRDAALEAMGLHRLAKVPIRLLSAGQLRRASLSRVIAGGNAIWLLDEPANGLDQESRTLLGQAIATHRAGGGIVVAATHQPLDLPDAVNVEIGDLK
jgi:heme exporter protein A